MTDLGGKGKFLSSAENRYVNSPFLVQFSDNVILTDIIRKPAFNAKREFQVLGCLKGSRVLWM